MTGSGPLRVRLTWVKRVQKPSGRVFWYWRRPGHKLVRLPDDPASPEFARRVLALNAMAESEAASRPVAPLAGSFGHLIARYKRSDYFTDLRPATRRSYSPYLDLIERIFGDLAPAGIDGENVENLRDRYRATPHKANALIRVLRLVLERGRAWGYTRDNPARSPRLLKTRPRRQRWGAAHEAAFMESAPEPMRLAFALALYTGQRQGDILRMTWRQYADGRIEVLQEKTSELVWIPAHRNLRAILAAAPKRSTMIVTTSTGRPFKADHFRAEWRRATLAAGIEGLQFRDLRRTAAVRLAEAGATVPQIAAVTGHSIASAQQIIDTYVPGTFDQAVGAVKKLEAAERRQNRRVATRSGNPDEAGR